MPCRQGSARGLGVDMHDVWQAENPAGALSRSAEDDGEPLPDGIGAGTFELDLAAWRWVTAPEAAVLFGLDSRGARPGRAAWKSRIFADDVPKLRAATAAARHSGRFDVELRVRLPDGSVHWLAGIGTVVRPAGDDRPRIRGTWHDITARKALESRLPALTARLEARVAEAREEARLLEILNRTGIALAADLDMSRLVQTITDAGVEISGAQFGAFSYRATDCKDQCCTLYALSGTAQRAFAHLPMPRKTELLGATCEDAAVVRSNDILADPRYGQNPPFYGLLPGHLPVRSYLAVPVISRSAQVLGGLFFGHADPGVFTERTERIVLGIAAQAAVALDNARLFQQSRQEVAARAQAEQQLQLANATLEERVEQRTRQLEESYGKLRDSERHFRLLVESVTDCAIFMLDPKGLIVQWNPGAERLLGYHAGEVLGTHVSRFHIEEERGPGLRTRIIANAALRGKCEDEGWRVRKDGTRFWAGIVTHAIRDELGGLIGFAEVNRDLTARRDAEERLRQSQKMEAIGQLTGGVAHDFNNLLTVISGNLETLQRRLADSELQSLQRPIDAALRASSRAAALTQKLLAYSRLQALRPAAVAVNTLIGGICELLRPTLPASIAIETVLTEGAWPTFVDANQLESCLLNLAVNARDAMPEGGRLTIQSANVCLNEEEAARAEVVPGEYVGLFVADTGTGMTKEVVAKAFDPFFTTKGIGQGTGLGLSQVYGFVKQSGGHVRICSGPGAGTRVRIYLPRHHAPPQVAEGDDGAAGVPRAQGETVLVVEDQPDMRSLSVEMLTHLGYAVLEAPDGGTALRVLDAHREIAVLFTDVGLPRGMDGRQLAEEAKRRRPKLKVLLTSGYADGMVGGDTRLGPDFGLIMKPFALAGLARKLRTVLHQPETAEREPATAE
jgi:PAS domain S-box-containing protein